MKSVVRVTVGIVVVLIGWVFWPDDADPLVVNLTSADQAAISVMSEPTASAVSSPLPDTTEPGHQTEQQAQLCPSAEQLGTSLQKLQQQRVSLTNQLIDLHIKLGIKKPETLQTLQAVGGDLEVFQYRQSAQKENFAYFKQQTSRTDIDKEMFLSVHKAIGQQDYDQVLELIQQFPIADRPGLFTHSQLSVLGHIIIGNPQIPFSVIQQFIDVGIQPFIADLAAFTALDLPLPLIDMVQQHYKGDLQQQWQDNFRRYNLTLLAAENASVALFDYWRALGVPASLHPQAPNAFDLIPLPASEQQLERQLSKVRTLLTAGILPRSADVRGQWLLLLPEQEAQQLSELLQQQPALPIEQNGPDATQLLALQRLQTEFNQLLQQVASCPTAQKWPVAVAVTRDLPERYYLSHLKMQQKSAQRAKNLTAADFDNVKKMSALLEKKDWQGIQDLMRQHQEIPAEEVDITVMMFMLMFQASDEEVQQHIGNFKQLTKEQLQRLSEIASPAHRELFKAAGFDLPFNAEAARRHQQMLELGRKLKKPEQRSAEGIQRS